MSDSWSALARTTWAVLEPPLRTGPFESRAGRNLRGFFLAPPLRFRDRRAVDHHFHDKALAVIGANLRREAIDREAAAARLQELLQRRLPVVREARRGAGAPRFLDERGEFPGDELLRRLDSPVEGDRGDERLVALRADGVLASPAGLF